MEFTIDLSAISLSSQKAIYLALKEKFESSTRDNSVSLDAELWDFCEISRKVWHILRMAGIHTVGELITWEKEDLLRLRGFGEKSLRDVEEYLLEKGLCLRSD